MRHGLAALVVAALAVAGVTAAAPLPGAPSCPVFLRWNDWNQRVDHLPVTPDFASSSTNPALPPMGLPVRLKADYAISGFPPQSRVVLQALKEHGMILADDGSDWYVSGAPDPGWSNDDLHSLHQVPDSAFEVVDSSLLIEPLAGATR